MSEFERKHMNKLKELGIRIWKRYVDDIFVTASNKTQCMNALIFINKQHANIKFTIEHEENGQLPFLDTCVKRNINKYSTTLYHKKTFTGVYLNWTSLTARRYKIGLINCLLNRIWRICTDEMRREEEIAKLKVILTKKQYPFKAIEQTINKFVEKQNMAEDVVTKKTEERYLKLPYVSRKCEEFAYRLKKLVETNFQQVQFNVAFQTPLHIGKLFPFKDNVKNIQDRSHVIYNIKCSNCIDDYIGMSKRILSIRVKEHRNPKGNSACTNHELLTGHRMSWENVTILDSAESELKLRYKELLHILKRKPELNKQLNSQSNYEVKTLIIKAYPQFRTTKKD